MSFVSYLRKTFWAEWNNVGMSVAGFRLEFSSPFLIFKLELIYLTQIIMVLDILYQ